MIKKWLGAIKWKHPIIVASVAGAIVTGLFLIVSTFMNSDDAPIGDSTTVSPDISVDPEFNIENNPSNVFEPTVTVGLDEKDVGEEVRKAVDPLRHQIKALSEQVAVQLAPKQPLPDSEDPLKVKAVEFYNAGVDAYHEGEIGQALGHWLDALKLDPDLAYAHYNLGNALKAKGELDAAIEHYSAALRIDPDYADAYNNLGNALAAKGELDAAIEQYNAAVRIDSDHAGAHNNLGNALRAKGELDAAIEQYNAAIRINPKIAGYHNNLAKILAHKQDAAGAVAALAKAIELDPRYRDVAKSDADFDPIRDDPAFRKLVYGE